MGKWQRYTHKGIAIHPYESRDPLHLNTVSGNRLDIREECNGWIKATCPATSSTGICPTNRVFIFPDGKSDSPFDLLLLEARSLFRHLFTKRLATTRHPDAGDRAIVACIQNSLHFLPLNPFGRQ
jgi:hypothetical protein